MLTLICPVCQKKLRVPDSLRGRTVCCPCGERVKSKSPGPEAGRIRAEHSSKPPISAQEEAVRTIILARKWATLRLASLVCACLLPPAAFLLWPAEQKEVARQPPQTVAVDEKLLASQKEIEKQLRELREKEKRIQEQLERAQERMERENLERMEKRRQELEQERKEKNEQEKQLLHKRHQKERERQKQQQAEEEEQERRKERRRKSDEAERVARRYFQSIRDSGDSKKLANFIVGLAFLTRVVQSHTRGTITDEEAERLIFQTKEGEQLTQDAVDSINAYVALVGDAIPERQEDNLREIWEAFRPRANKALKNHKMFALDP